MIDGIPTPAAISATRVRLGLTSTDLQDAIGYDSQDGRMVRYLEAGAKNGKPFKMSGPAAKSFFRMVLAHDALALLNKGEIDGAKLLLRGMLPDKLSGLKVPPDTENLTELTALK